jgi:hypothetical protein
LPLAADRKAVFQTLSRADLLKYNASKKERMAAKREDALVVVKQLLAKAHLSALRTNPLCSELKLLARRHQTARGEGKKMQKRGGNALLWVVCTTQRER